ncbi:MAG TPA: hypothetical protein PLN19_06355 [Methanothrix sp.]|jgi:hypothetical protein|nr:hypothetical protein [Methanothrix sp.]HOV82346.1 hypothetical protein [Methanothrix sp.]HPC90437.1 hypothetical protein [Methanothrix sp.]HQE87878.1 hypothetical protein [Methanothrix sp.]HRS85232.1 hypothetical protein [Methanothrix sp.]
MAEKKAYWDMQKSFWMTPPGVAIWLLLLAAFLGGGLLYLNLQVSPYPVIESFKADPPVLDGGGASNLSWSVVGAEWAAIDQGIGEVGLKGSTSVAPEKSTSYTIYARNGSRNRSMSLKVMVMAP